MQGSNLLTYRTEYGVKLPKTGTALLFGDLVKHLPELVDDVPLVGWGHSYVVHLSAYRILIISGPPVQTTVYLTLRHGHNEAVKSMVGGRETDRLKNYMKGRDILDIVDYQQSAAVVDTPPMRINVFGDIYMDFRRTSRLFGEPIIYLTALHILSHAVRYNAEQWKRLLDDHPREAIIVDRFLDVALRKLPNLILNELHGDVHQFRFAR